MPVILHYATAVNVTAADGSGSSLGGRQAAKSKGITRPNAMKAVTLNDFNMDDCTFKHSEVDQG